MQFNLAPAAKKKLEPNPLPNRLSAAECQRASDKWLMQALLADDKLLETIAIDKSAMYEQMAHDGRP